MNYIYDILLNFQENFYDFFEWNLSDDIYHIRKIPLFRVSKNDFKLFKYGVVCFDRKFLDTIYNYCEQIKQNSVSHINYAFVVSDGKDVMALKLNKKGFNSFKSGLLIDEADDIVSVATGVRTKKISYSLVHKALPYNFRTRFETESYKKIIKNLEELWRLKENDKIKYLYLECFNKNALEISDMYEMLKKEIENFGDNYFKIFDFFKMINAK